MLIERPPEWVRRILPEATFRMDPERKVYLTFDDGPIPEATPRTLEVLDKYGIKATFFVVGDNVRKYPELYAELLRRGHSVGNHTMHHVQGLRLSRERYLRDVAEASGYVESRLFRPPHGWLRKNQYRELKEKYRIVMYDLVTRDYSRRLTSDDVFDNVRRYARPGSVIVFHDSLKSLPRFDALPRSIEWLIAEGYEFGKFEM